VEARKGHCQGPQGQRSRGGDRVKPTLERCRRLNVEGFKEATERSVAQGRLHVTGADWRPPKTVTCYNSLDYSFDCVLYSWVGG
jgi:hypothetical protein